LHQVSFFYRYNIQFHDIWNWRSEGESGSSTTIPFSQSSSLSSNHHHHPSTTTSFLLLPFLLLSSATKRLLERPPTTDNLIPKLRLHRHQAQENQKALSIINHHRELLARNNLEVHQQKRRNHTNQRHNNQQYYSPYLLEPQPEIEEENSRRRHPLFYFVISPLSGVSVSHLLPFSLPSFSLPSFLLASPWWHYIKEALSKTSRRLSTTKDTDNDNSHYYFGANSDSGDDDDPPVNKSTRQGRKLRRRRHNQSTPLLSFLPIISFGMMDTSSIITQVTREGSSSPVDGEVSRTFNPSTDSSAFKGGGGGSLGAGPGHGNNNNTQLQQQQLEQSTPKSIKTASTSSNSGSESRRHKGFLHTLMCCFRWKRTSSPSVRGLESNHRHHHLHYSNNLHQGGVGSGGGGNCTFLPYNPSAYSASVNDSDSHYFSPSSSSKLSPGKCLLPSLKSSDRASHQMCLVIDLDETLVHSSFKPIDNADFIVPVEIDGTIHQVYVLKRPYVDDFLQTVGKLYECVLFTASLAKYADPVADHLDKWGVFRSRLFRESCVFYRGNYVKDLGRLGRDLHKVIIVDNSPASYIFHPDNAVPVASWFDNMEDTELRDLIPFFEKLSKVENIYTILRNANHVSPTPPPPALPSPPPSSIIDHGNEHHNQPIHHQSQQSNNLTPDKKTNE